MTASLELQKAINTALAVTGVDVYDHRPEAAVSYPMFIIGDDSQGGNTVKTGEQVTVMAMVTVFSDYTGAKEAKELLQAVRDNCLAMALDTYQIVGARVADSRTRYNTEDGLYQGNIIIQYSLVKQ